MSVVDCGQQVTALPVTPLCRYRAARTDRPGAFRHRQCQWNTCAFLPGQGWRAVPPHQWHTRLTITVLFIYLILFMASIRPLWMSIFMDRVGLFWLDLCFFITVLYTETLIVRFRWELNQFLKDKILESKKHAWNTTTKHLHYFTIAFLRFHNEGIFKYDYTLHLEMCYCILVW